MTELEYKMLKKKKNILNSHEKDDPSGEEDGFGDQNMEAQVVAKRGTARKGLGVKDKVQFKRKRAKEGKDGDATLRSRKKRGRSRKGKKTLEADG